MEFRYQIGRPLLLLVLLGLGVGLIWHIGHNIIAQQGAPASTAAPASQEVPRTIALPVNRPDQTPPAQTAESKPGAAAPETVASPIQASPEKKEVVQAKPQTASSQMAHTSEKTASGQAPPQAASRTAEPLPAALKRLQSRTTNPRLLVNERGRFLTSEPILFNSGLAQLRAASIPALNKLVTLLREMPDVKLEIAGYTDNIGIESANEQISALRAAAVREYLVSQGIDPSRLESKGMGSKDPIASNATQLGRQGNRRIEFRITSPK